MTLRKRTRILLRVAALLVAGGLVGFAVAASGIVPIAASSGHWAVTEWFLQFAKHRSIATHSIGIDVPSLDEPWLIMKGAGHYEAGCRPCHGAPDRARPRYATAMLPPPPRLETVVTDYDAGELFYIVKHGIKLTGMPAWPARGRDDEVHAVVAFLRVYPALDATTYRRLVDGDPSPARAPLVEHAAASPIHRLAVEECARCHGHDGRGRGNPAFPRLAGQKREYLSRALAAYARERRHSGIMGPLAAPLTTEQQHQLAAYYNALPAAPPDSSADPARVARGRLIATTGIPGQDVPPCNECHAADGVRRNAAYPLLAGQYADYLVLQLELFARDERGGSDYAHLMERTAKRLTTEQMRDVAAYFAAAALVESAQGRN